MTFWLPVQRRELPARLDQDEDVRIGNPTPCRPANISGGFSRFLRQIPPLTL
jgi:hypothetical protein